MFFKTLRFNKCRNGHRPWFGNDLQIKLLLLMIVFAWVAVVTLATSALSARPGDRKDVCINPAIISVADETFYVPRRWKIDVTFIEPGDVRDLCETGIRVNRWSAFIPVNLLLEGTSDATHNDSPIQPNLQIRVFDATNGNFHSLYQDVTRFLSMQNIKPVDLPQEGSFRVWRRKDWPNFHFDTDALNSKDWSFRFRNIYISDQRALLSSKKEPAVIVCRPAVFRGKPFEDCTTSIWDGKVDFRLRGLQTRRIPKSKFDEVYSRLLSLRQSLISGTTINTFDGHQSGGGK